MSGIYVAYLDEVPTLRTEPHEVCEPEVLTDKEIVAMWDGLKNRYTESRAQLEEARQEIEQLKQRMTNCQGLRDKLADMHAEEIINVLTLTRERDVAIRERDEAREESMRQEGLLGNQQVRHVQTVRQLDEARETLLIAERALLNSSDHLIRARDRYLKNARAQLIAEGKVKP